MDSPLDDVVFLALSENRIALLEVLSDEHTHHRDELMERTDVSRPTLARVLDDFESRAWTSQHGQTCRITPLGAWVHEKFTGLLEMMDTAQQLRDVMRWIPDEAIDHNIIRHLDDAALVFATDSEPMAPIRRSSEHIRGRTHLRFLTSQVTVSYFSAMRDSVCNTEMSVAGVVTPAVCQTLATDLTLNSLYRELAHADTVELFITEDPPPILHICDGNVGIGLIDEAKNPQGLILSDDDTVLTWATATFEAYREDATSLTLDRMERLQERSET